MPPQEPSGNIKPSGPAPVAAARGPGGRRALHGYLLTLAIGLLAAPVISLLVLRGAHDALSTELRSAAGWILSAVVVLPSACVGGVLVLGRRRGVALARCFRALVRLGLAALAVLLVAQGVVLILSLGYLTPPPDSRGVDDMLRGYVVTSGLLILGATGVGLVVAGFLVISQWRGLFEVMPIDVDGTIVTTDRMPDLATRVARIASLLGARAPTRIIVGLRPTAFVTRAQLALRGSGILPLQETLYVPLAALRTLDGTELDALIGHELGHFRGEDLYLTERFVPAMIGLQRSMESVATPGARLLAWGRLPAMCVIAGMFMLVGRVSTAIMRSRELAADRAAAEASSGAANITGITKMLILSMPWNQFARTYGRLAHKGVGRRNLVKDYVNLTQRVIEKVDRQRLVQGLLRAQIAHPFDLHPPLAQRASALGVNAEEAVVRAIADLAQPKGTEICESVEEEVTATEMELARLPGRSLVVDDREMYPPTPTAPSESPESKESG